MLTRLTDAPIAGVAMGNVALLRLDAGGGLAPGNKHFKLMGNLAEARRLGVGRLVSFGGPWSNHLHALAAVGAEQGFATVGIVRGDEDTAESAMLADARDWGMQLVRVSRAEYRRRHDPDYLSRTAQPLRALPADSRRAAPTPRVRAAAWRSPSVLKTEAPGFRRSAGPGRYRHYPGRRGGGARQDYEVIGVTALKGAADLEQRVGHALASLTVNPGRALADPARRSLRRFRPGQRRAARVHAGVRGGAGRGAGAGLHRQNAVRDPPAPAIRGVEPGGSPAGHSHRRPAGPPRLHVA